MAKVINKPKQTAIISKRGLFLFFIGLITLGIGFILMALPPVNGFFSRTLAPIVLVVGYLIIIPISIFLKDRKENN